MDCRRRDLEVPLDVSFGWWPPVELRVGGNESKILALEPCMLEFHRIRPSETAAKTIEFYRNPRADIKGFFSQETEQGSPLTFMNPL